MMFPRILMVTTLFISLTASALADSLFTKAAAARGTFVSDEVTRYQTGDIITVLVRETVEASTTANTNTKKESDVSAVANPEDNEFLIADDGLNIINPSELPNWDIEAENEHRATGTTTRASELTMTVACVVVEVFENGNIRIEGTKQVTVNREDSTIILGGVARSRDITAANTILSSQLADATVQLQGKGPLWNNQRRGLITKLLDWFSPF